VKSNSYSQVEISEQEAFTALYTNKIKSLDGIYIDNIDVIDQYNRAKHTNADRIALLEQLIDPAVSLSEFDATNQADWFMPDEYKNMDIEEFLVEQCPEQNYERIIKELELFRQHNMMDLLKYLKYLVDTLRENKVMWGVGRGSSVASYCLYLIGVHKVDSVKYDLDIHEFLK
jgi:DNA polymerase III alpha subunit